MADDEADFKERTVERTKVYMTGAVVTAGGTYNVTVRDVSRRGARISLLDAIPGDCDALLRLKSLFAPARVAWANGHDAGLSFYRELTPDEVWQTFGVTA